MGVLEQRIYSVGAANRWIDRMGRVECRGAGERGYSCSNSTGPIGFWSQSSSVLMRACHRHHIFARAGRLWLQESIRRLSSGAGVRYLMQSIRVLGVPVFQNDADRGPVQAEPACGGTEDGARIAIADPASSCRTHQKSADRRSVPAIARDSQRINPVRRWSCQRVRAVPPRWVRGLVGLPANHTGSNPCS